jgi:hypothetical protein
MTYIKSNKSTQNGLGTPHGLGVPHRMPTIEGENLTDILADLTRKLYPTGRAWWMQNNTNFDKLHKAINVNFIRVIEDSNLTIDSTIPDNDNFAEEDVILWEYRLGLITNPLVSLALRIEAIKRKMSYPSNIKSRQHPLFIESQLRLAGFDVYIYENKFFEGGEWVYKTPDQIAALSLFATEHGVPTQHGGGTQHGFTNFDVIANEVDVLESFSVGGSNLWATFFIGGENLGDVANIPTNRLREFKELVLKLKPAHTVAFTFINYT